MLELDKLDKRIDYMRNGKTYAQLYRWFVCPSCHNGRWVRKSSYTKISFTGLCRACYFANYLGKVIRYERGGWKGGRIKTSGGYISIWVSPNDFFYPMATGGKKSKYIREHRLVMAKHLNRCLLPWEVVHHRNGIKDNNRIENLELLPTSRQHLPDSALRQRFYAIEKRVTMLEAENTLLRQQVAANYRSV